MNCEMMSPRSTPPEPPPNGLPWALVVLLARLGRSYGLVGSLNRLEPLLGRCVTRVAVGVVLPGEFAVGPLDFRVCRVGRNA